MKPILKKRRFWRDPTVSNCISMNITKALSLLALGLTVAACDTVQDSPTSSASSVAGVTYQPSTWMPTSGGSGGTINLQINLNEVPYECTPEEQELGLALCDDSPDGGDGNPGGGGGGGSTASRVDLLRYFSTVNPSGSQAATASVSMTTESDGTPAPSEFLGVSGVTRVGQSVLATPYAEANNSAYVYVSGVVGKAPGVGTITIIQNGYHTGNGVNRLGEAYDFFEVSSDSANL